MAPNLLSRFAGGLKGSQNADPNGRHARMATASSGIGTTSNPSSPPAFPTSIPLAPPMPKLMLTTENSEEAAINAPSTPLSTRKSILDDETVTMSPEEARSSEEEQRRVVRGRTLPAVGASELSEAEQATTTTTTSTRSHAAHANGDTDTPRGTQNPLAAPALIVESSKRPMTAEQSTKKLTNKASNTSMRKNFDVNTPSAPSGHEGTRSRSNTQLLALPSDGDGGGSDTASVISASGKKKKKPWRKASTSSFRALKGGPGGGIGAALAASGMSMAHPTIVPSQQVPTVSPERLRRETMKITQPQKNLTLRRGSVDTYGDSEGAYDSDSQDGMNFDDHDIPITGFAVASSKRNVDFHELFPDVPNGDYLIEDYGCALQREILLQGRLYISENHMCFHANIFGWVTNFTVPFTSVVGLEKRMTAFVIPNAIQVTTTDQKYVFASFLSRDTTFDVISNIWRLSHPGGQNGRTSAPPSDAGSIIDGKSEMIANGDNGVASPTELKAKKPSAPKGHPPTVCDCSLNGQHFAQTMMETVFPGTPEKIYNLIFSSGFMKDFMANEQKLTAIQISDWYPSTDNPRLLARNTTFIKPLNAPVGPKSAKCELKDETMFMDFDKYISVITVTKTPEVPSGTAFAVKTRTCIVWAGPTSSKIVVTSCVEWTARSFLKSIIESSAISGQRTYHVELEKAMRQYISEHPTEFLPEGVDAAAVVAETPLETITSPILDKPAEESKPDPRTVAERRAMQWVLDIVTNALKLTAQSVGTLIDIIGDLLESAPDMPDSASGWFSGPMLWYGLVAVLVFMNWWTWSSLSQSRAREKLTLSRWEMMGPGYGGAVAGVVADGVVEKERLAGVATEAVKLFWDGVVEKQNMAWKTQLEEEMETLRTALAALEQRVAKLDNGPATSITGFPVIDDDFFPS